MRNLADERKQSPRRKATELEPLTEDQIAEWAENHYQRTGEWPGQNAGAVFEAPEETWSGLDHALERGSRELPGGSSIAKLLERKRGVHNVANRPTLTTEQILRWAEAHHERTMKWPNLESGQVIDAPGETWSGVNAALSQGGRGLTGGITLALLLQKERNVRNRKNLPRLSENQVLEWAKSHFARTGYWPTRSSGRVLDAPDETWINVDQALRKSLRGLAGCSPLAQLIKEHRRTLT